MPRGRPFSGKKKKQQLLAKREKKRGGDGSDNTDDEGPHHIGDRQTPRRANENQVDRYKLDFENETTEELTARKQQSMQPYVRLTEEELEVDCSQFYNEQLMFPVRPPWNYRLSLNQLEKQEQEYFSIWWKEFVSSHSNSYCEKNLETWRQLWRVLEMSDMFLLIIDVRFAALHFNPVLYYYITKTLKKQVIVILNKCDVVPAEIAIAWKHYLLKVYPELEVVIFTSYPKDERTREALARGKQSKRRRKRAAAVGPSELWSVCNRLVGEELDITDWKHKIDDDMRVDSDEPDDSDMSDTEVAEETEAVKPDLTYFSHQKFKDNILTIGCIGYPNVGKSSVINGLMGKKVVSISKTPGHTKHFQTIFLTKTVRLCDCPGLVFPSVASKPIQVLAGMYRIAQLREPYTCVQYIAERVELPAILGLRLPEDEEAWSAYLICDALAEAKGFKTAKGARNDQYRAANWILRSALEGKVLFYLLPPGFNKKKEQWKSHDETKELTQKQLDKIARVQKSSDLLTPETATASSVMSSSAESESDSDQSPGAERLTANSNAFSILAIE